MEAASPTVDSETEVTLKQRKNACDGLFDMTQDELCNYLVSINADEEFIQNIVGNQIDGAQWGAMFSTSDNKVVEGDEYKEIISAFASEKTPSIFKIKVKTHLTLT